MSSIPDNPFNTGYRTYLILGDTSLADIWSARVWLKFTTNIQPLVNKTNFEGEGKIRHLVSATYDYVNYDDGINWDEKMLSEIPTLYEREGFSREEIEFSNHSFSFPSIQKSLPLGFTPELVINVEGTDRPGAGFNFAVLIVVRNDILENTGKRNTSKLVKKIARDLEAKALFYLDRPWAFPIDEVAYSGAIQDEYPVAIVKTLEPLIFFNNDHQWKRIL